MTFEAAGMMKVRETTIYIVMQIGRNTTPAKLPPVMFKAWRREV